MKEQYNLTISDFSKFKHDEFETRTSEPFVLGDVSLICHMYTTDHKLEFKATFQTKKIPIVVAYRFEFIKSTGESSDFKNSVELNEETTSINFNMDYNLIEKENYIDFNDNLNLKVYLKIVENDSYVKKCANYAGLKNQGTTCYMNSLLQSLFHIPAFRRIVYQMPTDGTEDPKTCIPLNLQRLFCQMQMSSEPCSTKCLTKSFGWGDMQTIMQHDIQEFSRVLLDNLETKMKGTSMEKSISNLFKGQFRSFIRCKNVNYESSKIEDFYDLTLIVKNCKNLKESFEKYTETEEMTGANQYSTDEFGKQDAEMGVEFISFPPILHLHLSRFEYDYDYCQMTKINDRFEFPEEIDLTEFLAKDADKSVSNIYVLFDVLVHMGDVESGHYYAYIRTSNNPQWYLFNDDVVTEESAKSAIEENFGEDKCENTHYTSYGRYYGNNSFQKSYCAYMLVYIKKDEIEKIFQPISNEEVPSHLLKYLEEEEARKKAKAIEKDSIKINIITEKDIQNNTLMGYNGYEPHIDNKLLKLDKNKKLEDLYNEISLLTKINSSEIRLWKTSYSKIPSKVIKISSDKSICSELSRYQYCQSDFNVFVQKKCENEDLEVDKDTLLILIKFFFKNPGSSFPIQYIGTELVSKNSTISSIFANVNHKLGFPEDTILDVYQECLDNTISKLNPEDTFHVIKNGTILILQLQDDVTLNTTFQLLDPIPEPEDENDEDNSKIDIKETEMPLIKYTDILSIEKVQNIENYFNDKNNVYEFNLYSYDNPKELIARFQFLSTLPISDFFIMIAKITKLDYDSQKDTMLIYKKDYTKDKPYKEPIRTRYPYTISNQLSNSQYAQKIYYRLVKDINEEEFEQLVKYDIQYSDDGVNVNYQKSIFAEKDLTPKDLLEKLNIPYENNKFRYFQIANHQLQKKIKEDEPIINIYYTIRIERIPEDQKEIKENEKIIYAVFYRLKQYYTYSTPYGNPFLFKIIENEKFSDTKKRLLEKLNNKNQILKYEIEVNNQNASYFKSKKIVNDEMILFDLLESKDELCIVLKSKENVFEQSVKIFN